MLSRWVSLAIFSGHGSLRPLSFRRILRRFGQACALAMICASPFACFAAKPAAIITLDDGPKHCVSTPGTQLVWWQDLQDGDTCRVVGFSVVPHSAPPVYYQLQAYLTPGQTPETEQDQGDYIVGGPNNDGAGVVLLVPSPGSTTLTRLQGWSGSDAVIYAPRIVQTSQGPILLVKMTAMASAHPNEDVVFRAIGGAWTPMTDDWGAKVVAPKGAAQSHGNAMDWPTLRAYGAFWKPHDAQCCPTGGSYIAQLRLDGSHLRLASIRYSRDDLPFP